MAHVIVLDSVTEDIFVCGLCKSVFNSLQIFLDHKSFKCSGGALDDKFLPTSTVLQTSVLNEPFSSEALAIQEGKTEPYIVSDEASTHSKDHICEACKKNFKNTKSFLVHMKTHNENPFQCLVCGRCFNQNSHLQRHITSHKVWPDGLTQTTAKTLKAELLSYSCPYCNFVLSSYSQYRAHLKNHVAVKKFKCIQHDCMEFCDTIESLLKHINMSHDILEYVCHLCRSTFGSLEDIATHQNSHRKSDKGLPKKIELYKCTQCDAEFRKSEKLALHMLTENHNKVCIHCNKIFASDKRLRLHLQTHAKYKPFQCQICNISFPMKKYLSAHMLKHGSKKFKCTVCKYMFKRSDLLKRHMRLHQAKKLFKCPFKDTLDCNREFSRSDKLKLHIKSHTKYVSMTTTCKPKL